MSAFGGLIFTNKGRNLQAKAQAGATLNFTRIAVGDGDLGGSSIADLNALKHEVKSLGISRLKTLANGKAVVGTILSNQDLVTGFYFKELGVFAQDPDLGEILYCYGNAGANAEYIPAGGGPDVIEKNVDVITIVGNASSITAVIDESLIFATTDDLNNLAGAGRTTETVKGNADAHAAHLADNAAHNAVRAGDDNKDTQEVKMLLVETDTRSVEITRTSGQISGLTVKDPSDASTVASVAVNRTSGQVSSIVATIGARTITTTINRTSGQVTSITKAVV